MHVEANKSNTMKFWLLNALLLNALHIFEFLHIVID